MNSNQISNSTQDAQSRAYNWEGQEGEFCQLWTNYFHEKLNQSRVQAKTSYDERVVCLAPEMRIGFLSAIYKFEN